MPVYEINGYEVEFPHEAYECQVNHCTWRFLPTGADGRAMCGNSMQLVVFALRPAAPCRMTCTWAVGVSWVVFSVGFVTHLLPCLCGISAAAAGLHGESAGSTGPGNLHVPGQLQFRW